jgi:DNA-binding NarL/FixJ family response regulator
MKSKRSVSKSVGSAVPRKIFIVEDHPVFREGLVQIINGEGDLTVCGQAEDAETALQAIPGLKPDLVLIDITLPGKSGLELIKELRDRNGGIKLLVLSMHDESLYADRVLQAGGDGYIMKQEDPEEVVHAIHDVLEGHIYVSEEVLTGRAKAAPEPSPKAKAKTRPLSQLTDEEIEILEPLGQGKSDADIAHQLGLSKKEVAASCARMQRKLNLKSSNALIRYAVCWVESGKG